MSLVDASGPGSPAAVLPSFRCCDVHIDAVGLAEAAQLLVEGPRVSRAVHLCNAYTCSLALRDPAYREMLNRGDLNFADGFPVALVGRRLGHAAMASPVPGRELLLQTMREGLPVGLRHYLYGSTPEVVLALADRLRQRFPGLLLVGVESPPFRDLDPEEEKGLVDRVRASGATVVWVGLGTPRQDWFVDRLRDRLDVTLVAAGAAFDFLAGAKPTAPAWMQRAGLEWAFRLGTEPRRLWRRYLLGNTLFLYGVGRDAVNRRRTGSGQVVVARSGDQLRSRPPN